MVGPFLNYYPACSRLGADAHDTVVDVSAVHRARLEDDRREPQALAESMHAGADRPFGPRRVLKKDESDNQRSLHGLFIRDAGSVHYGRDLTSSDQSKAQCWGRRQARHFGAYQ